MWVAIVLLSGNLFILSLMWFKAPINNLQPTKEMQNPLNRHKFEHRIADELQLSPQQIEQYRELRVLHRGRIRALRDSIRQKKWLIHQELAKDKTDMGYINELSDSIGQLNAKFEKLNYKHFFELKNELNNDQLDRFNILLEQLYKGNRYNENRGRRRNRR